MNRTRLARLIQAAWPAVVGMLVGIAVVGGLMPELAVRAEQGVAVRAQLPDHSPGAPDQPAPEAAALLIGASRVAYIYDEDTAAGASFNTFLTARGLAVDLVALTDTAAFDFSSDEAIIIGADTYTSNFWSGTTADVDNIDGAGKPIIGLGFGGSTFFTEVGLFIDYWQSGSGTDYRVVVVDAANPIWTSPNNTGAISNSAFTVYTNGVYFREIYNPTPVTNVTRIGREYGGVGYYYPIIAEMAAAKCYLLWGFEGLPEAMTLLGQDLFINALAGQACPSAPYLVLDSWVEGGNGDGVLECGETASLWVDVRNDGTADAQGVTGALSTSDGYVTVTVGASTYPDITSGVTQHNSTAFEIEVDPETPSGHNIVLDLDLDASSGGPWTEAFTVPVSCALLGDDFDSPRVMGSMPYTDVVDTAGATQAGDDPAMSACSAGPGLATMWYQYNPSLDGELQVDTIGSSYNTVLAVWTGSRGSLVMEGCDDDGGGGYTSQMTLTVESGTTYHIEVAEVDTGSAMGVRALPDTPAPSVSALSGGELHLHVSFTAGNQLPYVVAVTPSSGSAWPGEVAFFTTSWCDDDGWEDLKWCMFHVGETSAQANNVFLNYNVPRNRIMIRNNLGTKWWGGKLLGSDNVIQNNQGIVYCALSSAVRDGNCVEVTWAIEFKAAFAGTKNTYLKVKDKQDAKTKMVKKGTWTIE